MAAVINLFTGILFVGGGVLGHCTLSASHCSYTMTALGVAMTAIGMVRMFSYLIESRFVSAASE